MSSREFSLKGVSMKAQTFAGGPGYLFILIGIILSLLSAIVPYFNIGYELRFSVFFIGLLPWLVYSIAVPLLRGTLTNACGLLLVIAHGWLVVTERYVENVDYSDNIIYFAPIIMAVLLLPLAFTAVLRDKM